MSCDSLAALDLGSNTFRLIIAEAVNGKPKHGTKKVWQELPRLSEGLSLGGKLAPKPLERAWIALETFNRVIKKEKPKKILAGATMFARLASDGPDFLKDITKRYGWETLLLSGKEEAFLSASGVISGLNPIPDKSLIFDIGGRSTEFINTSNQNIIKTQSLPIGVVGLTEDFIAHDPPLPEELEKIDQKVQSILKTGDFSLVRPQTTLIGTAGTITTVAAMLLNIEAYRPELINNAIFTLSDINRLKLTLASETIKERLSRNGLHPKRADVIIAGLVEVTAIMKFFNIPTLVASDNSLLEGLWLVAAATICL